MAEIRPISPAQPIAAPRRITREENKPRESATPSHKNNDAADQENSDESLPHLDERA